MYSAALRRPAPWTPVLVLFLLALLTGCGINTIPTLEEEVNAGWAQVQNQYQRRADLIPNLVETVKGYAQQERDVLIAVTEARAKVAQMQLPPDILTNQEAFRQFEQNQAAAHGGARPAPGGGRAISRAALQPELSRSAVAARRNREPHLGGAARLHSGGTALQYRDSDLSGTSLGDGLRR